jgi:hypothetical protein
VVGLYGGYTWGPRFLMFASLPASLVLAAAVRRPPRRLVAASAVLAVLALSLWAGIDGQTYGLYAQSLCTANHYSLEAFCWYVPEFSVLWTPFVFHAPFSWRYPPLIAYAVAVALVVSWPLVRQWGASANLAVGSAWAAVRSRPAWRF